MIKADMMIYDVYTKKGKHVKRMKIFVIDEITGEKFDIFDKLLTEIEKGYYDLLIEKGIIKERLEQD